VLARDDLGLVEDGGRVVVDIHLATDLRLLEDLALNRGEVRVLRKVIFHNEHRRLFRKQVPYIAVEGDVHSRVAAAHAGDERCVGVRVTASATCQQRVSQRLTLRQCAHYVPP